MEDRINDDMDNIDYPEMNEPDIPPPLEPIEPIDPLSFIDLRIQKYDQLGVYEDYK